MSRHKTPLRYPGGKQKLTPFVLEVIKANDLEGGDYVEPYAGGAGVAMELLVDGYVNNVYLNDSSYHIYSFWKSILENTNEFCSKISRSILNVDEWLTHREIFRHPDKHSQLEVGFSTFYLNRTNRSGVLTGGVIGGLSQSGKWKIDARFPRSELIRRVELIGSLRDSIKITNLDAEVFFAQNTSDFSDRTLIYCDPPYFEKANRLYKNHYNSEDHKRIAEIIQKINLFKWIVSYDNVDQISQYYINRRKFTYKLQYNALTAYKGDEVFILSDDLVIPRNSHLPHINQALKENSHILHKELQ